MHNLNHIYRLVWSDATQSFVAVAETVSGHGKRGRAGRARRAMRAAALLLATGAASATPPAELPTGGAVKAGAASISQAGNVLTIQQNTARLVTDWQAFSIGAGGTVNFVQPGSSAVALNRVLGNDVSSIQGALNANGQVFIVNPNGVLFTKTAQVQTGSLVASTLDIGNDNFLAGRYTFSGSSTAGVTNLGQLGAASGGSVALVAARIVNSGSITADQGSVLMGAGSRVTLDLGGPVKLSVDEAALNAYIEQGGAVRADGGQVMLTTLAAGALGSSVINHTGITEARSLGAGQDGQIVLRSSHAVVNTGTLSAAGVATGAATPGANGGQLRIDTRNLVDAGTLDASSAQGAGGGLQIHASGVVQQTSASRWDASGATQGGSLRLQAGGSAWLSGHSSVASAQGRGGDLATTAAELTLAGAQLDASGALGGGRIRVGGGWQGGDADLPNAQHTRVVSTGLDVRATARGNGGTAVVWADGSTSFGGHIQASGGPLGGDGGQVEVSGKGRLTFGGTVDAKATLGRNGSLLLDPKNIEIVESISGVSVLNLPDPSASASENFGFAGAVELLNGTTSMNRIVVTSPFDDVGATDAGAVHVYNAQTGALVSTLLGSSANDRVGNSGITALGNGNFVVRSTLWGNGSVLNAGAVTWGNGSTGISGVVSASNSLVGSRANDQVGGNGITALSNGNYVVRSLNWDNGSVANAGAVTWGNGSTGTSGVVSASNSLVGSRANDQVGLSGVITLGNGNYVVVSRNWDNGSAADAGAVSWGNGSTGTSGVVSASNSLVGSTANDVLGNNGVTVLPNGNYLVVSAAWDNGSTINAGAVSWGNGSTGTSGVVSASNSLVGSSTGDAVGFDGITLLSTGNYVVRSQFWSNGIAAGAGAVTWGNGSTGTSGVVSASNSLVGSRANDQVGNGGITLLSNGNYVVRSSNWDNGSATDAGAVTWGNGSTGTSGVVSASNSLVGGSANDLVGNNNGVTALSNGNYVVVTTSWRNGSVANVGAVTWGNGSTGTSGLVSVSNSLVGSSDNDAVGSSGGGNGIVVLSNGNYVVRSALWRNGSASSAGAVTWGNGSTGTTGEVSASNSLVGSAFFDSVGGGPVVALSNGNYVVASPSWSNGSVRSVGAVTWGNGSTGTSGAVSASNSLVGSSGNDLLGNQGITALPNGNYVVRSTGWDNGSANDAGAVTWGNGSSGTTGAVSASNSLVGSSAIDQVGSRGITVLSNGNYLVRSDNWDNGSIGNAGAVTWGNASTGISGVVSASNSLVGSSISALVGNRDITILSNGNYLVHTPAWANGSLASAGAVTWGNGSTGTSGVVSVSNSLVGGSANDQVGNGGITTLSNGHYVVSSTGWDNGGATDAGAVTWGNGSTGTSGVVSASNSLVGSSANDQVGGGITALNSGNYVVRTVNWDNGSLANAGAVTFGNGSTGTSGVVSASNSLVGGSANDQLGSGSITPLSDGRVLVRSTVADQTSPAALADAGRVDILDATAASPVFTNPQTYATNPGASSTFLASDILALLNAGTNVVLQANNDITLSTALTASNPGGNGGALTLQAGRSLLINASITSDNGNLTLVANDTAANGVVDAQRDAGAAAITMANGSSLNAGTGAVSISLRDGAGNTHNTAGTITLGSITAGSLAVASSGFGGSFTVDNKVYDGALAAAVGASSLTGLAFTASSNLTRAPISASFASADAGTGKTVTAAPLTLSGFNGSATAGLERNGVAWQPTSTADITPRPITVVADSLGKVYGNADPVLTYSVTAGNLVGGDSLGALTRVAGENVGSYVINASALANGNYLVTANNGNLTISQRPITVTADAKTKVYGDADPVLTYSVTAGSLVGGDTLSVALTRASGENVGSYVINASALANGNYLVTANNGNLTISQRPITVTADAKTKVYGDADPTPTYSVTAGNLVGSDTLSVALTRASGENVGSYVINASALANGNYLITANSGNLTISQRPITVTADAKTKVYGNADPTLTYSVTAGSLVASDTLSVALTRASGENVGSYLINASALANGNYLVTANNGNLTISQRPITVTADAKTKVYGDADPALTYSLTAGSLVGSDTLSGALTRASGENVGSYLINASALANGNYLVTSNNGNLTISQRPITVTADAKTKVYGDADPALTYSLTAGSLVGSDTLSGALTRASGENVGSYLINASALANGNYLVTANNGNLTISQRPITVTADAKTKVYGNADPTLTYSVTAGSLVASDTLSVALTRASGENVGSYLINASALANGNYLVTANNGNLTISQRPITVTADAQAKTQGNPDPALTFQVTAGNLVGSDSLSGVLTRAPGEAVGTYLINAGALANGNYLITANNGTLRINQRPATLDAGDILTALLPPASTRLIDPVAAPDASPSGDAGAPGTPGGGAAGGQAQSGADNASPTANRPGANGMGHIRVVQGGIRLQPQP